MNPTKAKEIFALGDTVYLDVQSHNPKDDAYFAVIQCMTNSNGPFRVIHVSDPSPDGNVQITVDQVPIDNSPEIVTNIVTQNIKGKTLEPGTLPIGDIYLTHLPPPPQEDSSAGPL